MKTQAFSGPVRLRNRGAAALLAAALAAALAPAAAQTVVLSGSMGNRALLVIDGQPRTMAVGDARDGVKLVAFDGQLATVELNGRRLQLPMGVAATGEGGGGSRPQAVLKADGAGQFFATVQINGRAAVPMLVDTGATGILLTRQDADRAGIAYANAPRAMSQTANGPAPIWLVKLTTVKLGDIELSNVDAAVSEAPLPFGLLGMSFLNRTEMRRNGDTMTLQRRF
jgi:aspartyl protease family protein